MKLLIVALLFLPAILIAQTQQQLDSIEKTLRAKNGVERIRTLNDLAFYYSRKNTDKAITFGQEALKLARKQSDPALLASTLNDLSTPYITIGDYEKSIALNREALAIRIGLKDSVGMLSSYAKLGLSYQDKEVFDEAISYYKKALYLAQKLKLETQESQVLNNLSNILEQSGRFKEAYHTQKQALAIAKRLNVTEAVITILGNLGNTATKLKKYDEAERYYNEAIPMIQKSGQLEYLGTIYQAIGLLEKSRGNAKKALDYYSRALSVYEKINSRPGIAIICYNIGNNYVEMGNLSEAEKYLKRSLENAKFTRSARHLKNAYNGLANLEKRKGNFEQAFSFLQLSSAYKDSAQLEQGNSAMSEMYTRYQTEKKDKILAQQRLNSARQAERVALTELSLEREKRNKIIYAGVTLLLLIIVAAIARNLYLKRKAALEEIELTRKNEQLRRERELNEQKLEISRELHDNIGSQITYMISSMDNLTYVLPESDQLNERVKTISDYGRETMQELRSTIWAMNSVDGTTDTLVSKIGELRNRIPVELEINNKLQGSYSLKALEMLNLFRITQEAIQNAIKYSGCSKISIHLAHTGEGVHLTIADNGKGFDTGLTSDGNGLRNMKHRCESIAGSFQVTSGSEGTILSCDIRQLTY